MVGWWKCAKCGHNLLTRNVFRAISRDGAEYAYHRTKDHKACGLVHPNDPNPTQGGVPG